MPASDWRSARCWTGWGMPLVDVDSGLEALLAVSAQQFAVILMDVRMPGMNGYETAKLIRARGESGMTPIIFMTAFGRDEVETTTAYASGAVDFMFSPIAGDALRAKVTAFVDLFARAHEHQHSRAVLQNVAVGIVTVDEQGLIESVNRSALALFGYEPADVIGQPLQSIVAPSHRDEFNHGRAVPAQRRRADRDAWLPAGRVEFAIEIGLSEMQIGERTFTIAAIREAPASRSSTRPHRLRGGADRERDHRREWTHRARQPRHLHDARAPPRNVQRCAVPRVHASRGSRGQRRRGRRGRRAARPGRSTSRRATCTPADA